MGCGKLFEERLTYSVINAFFEVDRILGFGFLEHFYVAALERELLDRGHEVGREVYVPVFYKGALLGRQRIDMVVDRKLIIETKATAELPKSARPQLLNYLRATRLEIGLVLHFGPIARPYRVVCRNALKGTSLPSFRSV